MYQLEDEQEQAEAEKARTGLVGDRYVPPSMRGGDARANDRRFVFGRFILNNDNYVTFLWLDFIGMLSFEMMFLPSGLAYFWYGFLVQQKTKCDLFCPTTTLL